MMNQLKICGAVTLLLVAAACSSDDDAPREVPFPVISFGAYYVLSTSNDPPVLVGDSLRAVVAWSGCGNDHMYELRHRILSSTRAELWLFKVTPDEACQAFFEKSYTFRVPPAVLARERIDLVGPNFTLVSLR
jgi:hypothetical protein